MRERCHRPVPHDKRATATDDFILQGKVTRGAVFAEIRCLVLRLQPAIVAAWMTTTTATAPLTRREIETGRKLFAGDWDFVWAASSLASLPPMRGIEIAFAGRSNVGKSSLINALVGRKALARTSHTPGRTQELIFFAAGAAPLTLVDMPGYGYAAAPKDQGRGLDRTDP